MKSKIRIVSIPNRKVRYFCSVNIIAYLIVSIPNRKVRYLRLMNVMDVVIGFNP